MLLTVISLVTVCREIVRKRNKTVVSLDIIVAIITENILLKLILVDPLS